jgi:hypothetical protein
LSDANAQSQELWLGPGVAGIGTASFLADVGHEIPTALLPNLLTATLGAPRRRPPPHRGHRRQAGRYRPQELNADVEGSSGIDPGEFHPAALSASRCGHVHGGFREHRPGWIHDLEAVGLGVEVG